MKGRTYLSSGLAVLLAMGMVSCQGQEQETPPIDPDGVDDAPQDVWVAMLSVLSYLDEHYPGQAPDKDLSWETGIAPSEGLVGAGAFEFSADGWFGSVTYPNVAPDATIYQVEVARQDTSFYWQGVVDAFGEVTEKTRPFKPIEVVGWYGQVQSAPSDSPFDDYFQLRPEDEFQVGLRGETAKIEADITALRDKEEPANKAHFWGWLSCGVDDFGGCRLDVDRLRVDGPGPFFDPDPVEAWEGVIYSGPPGPRSGGDDLFILMGDFNIEYGIWGIDESVEGQLVGWRDIGTVVRVWGELMAGIPDWSGTQIRVNRIETVDVPSAPIPPPPDFDQPEIGIQLFTNDLFGYQLEFPEEAELQQYEVSGFPTEELPEGMSNEDYLNQLRTEYGDNLCVQVDYHLGYILIAGPPNSDKRYVVCGRTGVGVGELVDKSEEVLVGGETYTATGFEFLGEGETLDQHNETLWIRLSNGTVIEYGAKPDPTATYADYLATTKGMLLQILASYQAGP